jgi:hypothetical protein
VGYDFNHESPYTKRYVDDVNRYWLEEYKVDGYRFDLSKGFTQKNNPNDVGAWSAYDQSRIDLLKRMADKIWETDAKAYVSLEHLADNSEEKVLADYGMMLWGNLNHPYNDVVNGKTTTDLNWALSSTRNWNQKNLISYMESHDEERLLVRAQKDGASNGSYDIKQLGTALERVKLASAFYYTLPGPKMLWQFGELGYDVSIDFNGRTGNKPLPWGAADGLNYNQDQARVKLYKAKAAIINLVNQHREVFEQGEFSWTPSGQMRKINISHAKMKVTIIGNFGTTASSLTPNFQHAGTWYDFFSGQAVEVTSVTSSVSLDPGEFHIYVDQPVTFPEPDLLTIPSINILKPSDVTAQLAADATVRLTWSDNATGEQGYVVERKSEEQSSFQVLATLAENATQYSDTKVVDGVTYTYRMKAVSTVKPHSAWSDNGLVDLPLLAPVNLAATALNVRSVALRWEDRSAHETAYVVEKAELRDGAMTPFKVLVELRANATAFTDTKVVPGLVSYYRVVAKDADETSAYSNQVSIRSTTNAVSSLPTAATESISLFPNPAADVLTINATKPLPGPASIQIFTLQGTHIKTVDLVAGSLADVRLEVSGWREGIYVVQITSSGATTRQQLMIQR